MKQVKASIFLGEIPTDGHSPMKFVCSNNNVYYCKYRVNYKLEELDCLIYEVVCHNLLKSLGIPTPDIALVELLEGTFSSKDLVKNKSFAKPGIICFGSKEVKYANLITGLELVNNSESLNMIYNPYDLVKIAVFDLWINNADRGRNENYNLLTSSLDGKLKIWAFDHAFAFGGINELRIFNNLNKPDISNKLINTYYFKSMVSQLDLTSCLDAIEDLVSNFYQLEQDVLLAFEQVPSDWKVFPGLKPKIESFLLDSQRIELVRDLALSQLQKL